METEATGEMPPGSGTGIVTSTPTGIDCGSSCTASYADGTVVTLSEQPATGYTFTGWNGACTGTASCTVTMNSAQSVSATFSAAVATNYTLTVTDTGSGTGTVTSSPAGINCGSTCSSSYASGTVITLTAQAASGSTFGGWSGACTGTGTCTVTMSAAQSVSATFSGPASACAQNASSYLVSSKNGGGNSQAYWDKNNNASFGNYVVQFDDWGPDTGTLSMWTNSPTCWSASTTTKNAGGNNTDPGIGSYPDVVRGWTPNDGVLQDLSTAGYPNNPNWTTLSGMGIQVSALTKAHVKWAMSVPTTPNTNDTVARWDALMDIYFHTAAQGAPNPPSSAWLPYTDLQIMQMLMDQPFTGNPANENGYFAYVMNTSHPWIKTFGGGSTGLPAVTYIGVIDVFGPFNQSGGHTITMMPEPTMATNPSTTGLLWGPTSMVHDVGGIIAWLSQANPKDDSGNPIYYGNGTTVTSPVIPSSLYLTAINAGFEIDFGSANNNQWTTTDFWVAVQNEPDGQ